MRILLDTNILARAAAGPTGPAHELFLLATQHVHLLVLSQFLLHELSRVLRYERLRPVHGLSDEDIDQFVGDLVLVGEIAEVPADPPAIGDDPDDNPIIAAAVAGRSEALCTLDRHLHQPKVKSYLAQRGVAVMSDLELLAQMRKIEKAT